ncbi:hypothetical protein X777_04365 [Ooceraea biroi]|uniref:Uncharacterized protein n=1 Tax=Ooceraea biroi TaxID=2015173 RepID=A0A026WJW4_OOCBI|nr:hypothetical protein X777_04365 [Ooceraea biroi]
MPLNVSSHNELLLSVGCIVPHKSLQTGQQWRDATRPDAPPGLDEDFQCICVVHIE